MVNIFFLVCIALLVIACSYLYASYLALEESLRKCINLLQRSIRMSRAAIGVSEEAWDRADAACYSINDICKYSIEMNNKLSRVHLDVLRMKTGKSLLGSAEDTCGKEGE